MFDNPSVDDFKYYFFRDFPYGDDLVNVTDRDINNALQETTFNFNAALFGTQDQYTLGFLYLAAHMLVTNLRNSSQGIAGQYAFLQTGKNAGSVGAAMQIPQKILDNPELSMLCKTTYGAKYVMLLLPQLIGNIYSVRGHTKP